MTDQPQDIKDLTLVDLLQLGWDKRQEVMREQFYAEQAEQEREEKRQNAFLDAVKAALPPALTKEPGTVLSYKLFDGWNVAVLEIPALAPIHFYGGSFDYDAHTGQLPETINLNFGRGNHSAHCVTKPWPAVAVEENGEPVVHWGEDARFSLDRLPEALSLALANGNMLPDVQKEAEEMARQWRAKQDDDAPEVLIREALEMARDQYAAKEYNRAVAYYQSKAQALALFWIAKELQKLAEYEGMRP